MKKQLKTALQFLKYYEQTCSSDDYILKAMREYAKYKSDKAYESGYQSCLKQLWEKKN